MDDVLEKRRSLILRGLLWVLALTAFCAVLRPLLMGEGEAKSEQRETEALIDAIEADDLAAVEACLNRGAEVNTPCIDVDDEGQLRLFYPLIHAAARSQHATVRLLLDRGANVTVRRTGGDTALFAASINADAEMVQLLLQAGSGVNVSNDEGITPLIMSAQMAESAEVVQMLLRAGAEVNRADAEGCTALHYAALPEAESAAKCFAIMRILLENGAETDVRDIYGETALLQCARDGFTAGVRLLLEYKADPSLRNYEGKSPLDYARENGHAEVVELLSR